MNRSSSNTTTILVTLVFLFLLAAGIQGCQALSEYLDDREIIDSFEGENKNRFESSLKNYGDISTKLMELTGGNLKPEKPFSVMMFSGVSYPYNYKDLIDISVRIDVHEPFIQTDVLDDKIESVHIGAGNTPEFLATTEGVELIKDVLVSLDREVDEMKIQELADEFVAKAANDQCQEIQIRFGDQAFRKSCTPKKLGDPDLFYYVDFDVLTDKELVKLADDYYALMERKAREE